MDASELTVIVPAYNTEEYLDRCISSIEKAGKNVHIIIVNDGSTDETLKKAKHRRELNPNVTIIDKKNEGLFRARIDGVRIAVTQYVTFCDSDDYIVEHFYDRIMASLSENRADILEFGVRRLKHGKISSEFVPKEEKLSGVEAISHLLNRDNSIVSNWNKIYDRELFEDVEFFEKIRQYEEDKLINVKVMSKARLVRKIPDIGYIYEIREGSITHRQDREKEKMHQLVNEYVYQYLYVNVPELRTLAAYDYCVRLAYSYCFYAFDKENKEYARELKSRFKRIFKENQIDKYKDNYGSYRRKIMMKLMQICPIFCAMSFNCFHRITGKNK